MGRVPTRLLTQGVHYLTSSPVTTITITFVRLIYLFSLFSIRRSPLPPHAVAGIWVVSYFGLLWDVY